MGRRYKSPPVVEALCEVRFAGSEWDATIPGLFYDRVRDRFPGKEELSGVEPEARFDPGRPGAQSRLLEPRLRFRSRDGARLVQVGRDLVVVNQLRPCPHFEDWGPIVLEMVGLYRQLARPKSLARLGLRYINHIVIHQQTHLMETYFRIYAEVPQELGRAHGPFLLLLELFPLHQGHRLRLGLGTAPQEKPGTRGFLLDLHDLFVWAGTVPFEEAEGELGRAHDNIEHAFESMITDQARALFEVIQDDASAGA